MEYRQTRDDEKGSLYDLFIPTTLEQGIESVHKLQCTFSIPDMILTDHQCRESIQMIKYKFPQINISIRNNSPMKKIDVAVTYFFEYSKKFNQEEDEDNLFVTIFTKSLFCKERILECYRK